MRQALRGVQPLMMAAAAIFIGVWLAGQWPSLRVHTWRLSAGWLLLSALCMLASWGVEIALWRALAATLGGRIAYLPAARIWFKSAIVRYVPGNIWQPLSMTLQAQQHGVRPEATVTSVALYQGIILMAAAPIAALYFWTTGNWGLLTTFVGSYGWLLILLVLAPVALFLASPNLLIVSLNWLLARVRRPPVQAGLGRSVLALLLVVAAFDWLLWGATFAALTFGVATFSGAEMAALAPHLIVAYAIAYCVGFLSFITPSGFGVREGALYVLLATVMDPAVVTVAALAMRVWTMAGEVLMATLAALTEPRRGRWVEGDAAAPVAAGAPGDPFAADVHHEATP